MLSASFVSFPLTGMPHDGNESFCTVQGPLSKDDRQNRGTLGLKLWNHNTSPGTLVPRQFPKGEILFCIVYVPAFWVSVIAT